MQDPNPNTDVVETPSLVLTKTRVPAQRSGLVRRTPLIDRLTESHDRTITLVIAPAGFGKSTLLTQWTEADPMRRFCWVTLEAEDNDPVTLMRYVLVALGAHVPHPGNAWALLDRPDPDLKAVVGALVNHLLDVPGRLVVVLDDYHVIGNPDVHEVVQYLIDHLPHSMQIALGTRTRPPLSMSALEARGLLLEIDRNDLRFTVEETGRALALSSHEIPSEESKQIHERTEGTYRYLVLWWLAASTSRHGAILSNMQR